MSTIWIMIFLTGCDIDDLKNKSVDVRYVNDGLDAGVSLTHLFPRI